MTVFYALMGWPVIFFHAFIMTLPSIAFIAKLCLVSLAVMIFYIKRPMHFSLFSVRNVFSEIIRLVL